MGSRGINCCRGGAIGRTSTKAATLWKRMLASLPDRETSPPQRFLFEEYHRVFGKHGNFPALLPEVWLHWDPKTKAARGEDAMHTFRMDFVMLLSEHRRVVLEVDGEQHYSAGGTPSPSVYAQTTRGDRDLRLSGYEVYRFAGYELVGRRGKATVEEFFSRLLSP